MSHHQRPQEQQFRRIAWMRQAKRLLKKSMIVLIFLLALAVILSYFLVTEEKEPQDIEVHKSFLDNFF